MAHPLKSEAANAHTAKMRSMTAHYGAASGPANNITSPQDRLKGEGGEAHVGFGADSANASAKRGDRPARRTTAANPLATYARGGKVKHRADGGDASNSDKSGSNEDSTDAETSMNTAMNHLNDMEQAKKYMGMARKKGGKVRHRDQGGDVSAIEEANRDQAAASKSTGGVIARARGGRAKHGKGATHVNVIVGQPGAGGPPPGAMPPTGPSPQLAALLAGAHPPMGGPPPGAPPMPPPGAGGPPGMPPGAPPPMMPRKKGGRVMGDHPDASQDKALIQKTLREEGLVRKAKGGGVHMTAGAVTGEGRLEKMHKKVVPLTKSDAQEV